MDGIETENSGILTRSGASYCPGPVLRRRRDCRRSVASDSNCDSPRKDYACCCDCCDDGDGGAAAVAAAAAAAAVAAAAVADGGGGDGAAARSEGRSGDPGSRSPSVALLACS